MELKNQDQIMNSSADSSHSARDRYKERFEAIQKRRQELCRGSEARRVNKLKLSILANVKQQLQSADELEELQKCSVNIDELSAEAEVEKQQRERRRGSKTRNPNLSSNNSEAKLPRLNTDNPVENCNVFSNNVCVSSPERIAEFENYSIRSESGIVLPNVVKNSGNESSNLKLATINTTCAPVCQITSTSADANDRGLKSNAQAVIEDIKSSTRTAIQDIPSTETVTKGDKHLSQSATKWDKPSTQAVTQVSGNHSEVDVKWLELKPYLTINDHLVKTTGSGRRARSHLEERLEKAIEANDVETAEIFSDRLAEREFGIRIASAIDAKAYLERQKAEKAAREAAKKKKLAWGFVPKHRWETKGNM